MKNLTDMFKQAQELQGKMTEMQERLQQIEITGSAGGGLVSVVLNGKGEMRSTVIDPSLVQPGEGDVIADLVVAAHHDAKVKLEQKMSEEMSSLTNGMPLPPGMKLPF